MKTSTKYLLFNRYILLAFLLVVVIPFFSWLFFSKYFEAQFWDVSGMRWTREEYFQQMFPFHMYPYEGFQLMQIILPLITGLMIIPFLRIKRLIPFEYARTGSYRKFLLKTVFKYLMVGCMVLYLAYLTFLLIGASFLHFREDPQIGFELFSDLLGKDFVNQHTFLYFVIDGFLRYFIFGFVYGLFSISLSFLTRKNYLCVLIPVAYYVGLDIILAVLNSTTSVDLFYLSPAYTLTFAARIYTNTFLTLAPLFPPLCFSIIVILRELIQKKKRNDVFAID